MTNVYYEWTLSEGGWSAMVICILEIGFGMDANCLTSFGKEPFVFTILAVNFYLMD